MNLREALRLSHTPRLALVGSGGKTTALFLLASQFDGPVLLSASTHLSLEQAKSADRHWIVEDPQQLVEHEDDLLQPGSTLITGPDAGDQRLRGASPDVLNTLYQIAERHQLPLLIEADGSRQLPLKAPAEHEPAIPLWADSVVVVAGLSALGQALNTDWVHRPERFSAIAGIPYGAIITAKSIQRVLMSSSGGLKGIPEGAHRVALLNQADTPALEAAAEQMAGSMLEQYDSVVSAALGIERVQTVYEREAGIILAAGQSTRFGAPKVLLEWHGKPFVHHTAETALLAGLKPVIVVVGAYETEVREALKGLPVKIIANPAWMNGQSTSMRAGLLAAGNVRTAIFMLADQPHIPEKILRELMDLHRHTLAPIIAPRVDGRRANPVLFDRVTFEDLQSVSGDQGGRAVMQRWPVTWLDSDDERLLLDIDTPEDYQRLLDSESL